MLNIQPLTHSMGSFYISAPFKALKDTLQEQVKNEKNSYISNKTVESSGGAGCQTEKVCF